MYFVYVLHSHRTGKFYIGQTADLQDRLARHNSGRSPAAKAGQPWKLVYTEKFLSRVDALRRERDLKSWRSHQRLERLIQQSPAG